MKGYVTNLESPTPEFVLGAYHQLWQIEKSFRMSKSDLRARPIYHHKRDSIEAHLTIVMAALAVSRWLERETACSIKKIVQTLRPYRSIAVQDSWLTSLCRLTLTPRQGCTMAHMKVNLDRETLRALAAEGNEKALDRLADLADARGDTDELSELLDEGSDYAGDLLTRRAVAAHDLRELQRLSDAGCEEAERELDRLLS